MSDAFVLDCSVTMAWFFAGEATSATDTILDNLNRGGRAVVAQHWRLEVGNTLLMGERRKRCTAADAAHFLGILGALPIDTDPETGANATSATLSLARAHALTVYDAAYLELAMRTHLPLATLDLELRSAAKRVGVKCLPSKI
jgi:predicted nucleic acid-binding protein